MSLKFKILIWTEKQLDFCLPLETSIIIFIMVIVIITIVVVVVAAINHLIVGILL